MAGVELATAYISLTVSGSGLGKSIKSELDESERHASVAGDRAGKSFGGGLLSSVKGIAGPLIATLGLAKIGGVFKDSVVAASDLTETGTKLQAVFGGATGQVEAFASTGAAALGQSKLDLLNSAAQFGVFGKAAKLQGPALAGFSTSLAGLSTDLASFYNTDPAQAAEAIAAGLRGESEPLRQYGILLDDATLRQKALKLGLIKTTKEALTPQQKVLAAQAVIMEQSTIAQGDFAKTSGGLANQQRILAATWDDMKAKLGSGLLPVATNFVSMLNTKFLPALQNAGKKGAEAWALLTSGDFQGAASGLGEEDSPLVRSLLFAHDTAAKLGPGIKEAWGILAHGDFQGGLGFEEDSPFVDFLFKLRDFGVKTFEKLAKIWDTLVGVARDLWPPLSSIAGTILGVIAKLSGAGLSVWDIFLGLLQGIADVARKFLVPAFTWLADFIKENPAPLYILIGALTAWKLVTLGIAAATKIWAAAQAIFNAVMALNPIAKIIIGLTLLAAAFSWAWQHSETFRDIVTKVWDVIKGVIDFAWNNVILPVFNAIKDAIAATIDFFANFGQKLSDFGAWVAEIFGKVIDWFAALPGRIFDVVTSIPAMLLELGAWLIRTVWNGINAVADLLWSWFTALPGLLWNLVTKLPGALLDLGKWIIKTIITGLGDLIAGAWDFLGWIGGLIYKGLSGLITLGAQAIGWIVIGLAQGVWNIAQWLWDAVTSAWNKIKEVGARIAKGIVDGLASALSADNTFNNLFNPLGVAVGKATGGGGGGSRGFAYGGHVPATPGGAFVKVAEAGHGEWMLPDPLLKQVISFSAGTGGGGGRKVADNVYITTQDPDVRSALNEALFRMPA